MKEIMSGQKLNETRKIKEINESDTGIRTDT